MVADSFVKGQVMVPELLRTHSMVLLEDTSEDSLHADTSAHTHKPERNTAPGRRPRFFAISGG